MDLALSGDLLSQACQIRKMMAERGVLVQD
jgi:hypothetical protein